ncbi:MAG: cobaltochelatase subunit CobN, partial [Thermodesulfobacteriota bacterium]|nr:cobaltochelatase subunit CobN [Thermodesulfobacteriota bacterium]
PKTIDRAKWEQTFAVYVEDKYGMDIQEFFNRENPWAYQSMTGRMLEAIRKEYWDADEETRKKLAVEYVMSVINKGVACCDHTCNNPLLNQMVVSIVSIPGVMSPVIVEEFKIAVEKAAGKDLAEQVKTREQLLSRLQIDYALNEKEPAESQTQKKSQQETAKAGEKAHTVEGYKMEQVQSNDESADLSSSGIQWFASIFIIMILGMVVFGVRRQTRNNPGD